MDRNQEAGLMPADYRHARAYLEQLFQNHSPEQLAAQLQPRFGPAAARIPGGTLATPAAVERRWRVLQEDLHVDPKIREALFDSGTAAEAERYQCNIENFI